MLEQEGSGRSGAPGPRETEAAAADASSPAPAERPSPTPSGESGDDSRGRGIFGRLLGRRTERRRRGSRTRRIPLFAVLGYYAALVALAWLLIELFPVLRDAIIAPLSDAGISGVQSPATPSLTEAIQEQPEWQANRALMTAVVLLGALLLVMPVAWVYTFVRRLRYDRSLVHTMIILPPMVAGIVMVVKNSLALAFSLAGIVAAVRFRTTVKDPKDAVHIFLVIGIGLAAGVQALDIALVMSVAFNVIALFLWKYDLDAVYASDEGELLAVGDAGLLLADTHEGRERVHERLGVLAEGIDAEGFLLVHTREPDSARQVAEVVLANMAKEWRFMHPPRGRNGLYTLEAAVRLKKKTSALDLLGELEDRWSPTVAAAEFVPYTPDDDE